MPEEIETPALKAKLEAEAEHYRASAEFNRAQVRRVEHEVTEARADVRIKESQARAQEIDLEREELKFLKEKAANSFHHIYPFGSDVSQSSVNSCINQLTEWMRLDPECDIEIVFNSPGGSVIHGMALWDFIQTVRSKGHKVTTSTIGYAASMAGILLQAGDVRVMGKESWLMIHEASFGAGGKIGEVEDTVEWVKRVCARIVDIFVDRCKHADSTTATKRLTKSKFVSSWRRKDWWISSEEALEYGLIDEIR